jgi:hypothetical protein
MVIVWRRSAGKSAPRAKAIALGALFIASFMSGCVVRDLLDQAAMPGAPSSYWSSTAFAQDNDTTGSGTRGASGWNGGARDVQPSPGTPQDLQRGAAANDPLYATGIDLKGAPVRYGPDRAPE